MLTWEENEQLTRVGPGTPMGEFLRRYWHPIAASIELKEHPIKAVKLLGESLVLYNDKQGRPGLLESACAHRRFNLVYGIPDNEGLRCAYHGWLYDATGQCRDMPLEPPGSTFKNQVKIKAYPVQELAGLVWAYLGPEPAPQLPRWAPLVQENVLPEIGMWVIPSNWLQSVENTLDPHHLEFLHGHLSNYVLDRLGVPEGDTDYWRKRERVRHHVEIGFDLFEYGIIKRRLYEGMTKEDPLWRIGHPHVFPVMEYSGNGLQIRVPMDDTQTLIIYYNAWPLLPGEESNEEVPVYKVPLPGLDEDGHPVWEIIDNNSGQDTLAWIAQGADADRTKEKLATGDIGIIMYRRLLKEQMQIAQDGGDPMNVFRDPAKNVCLKLPREDEEGGGDRSDLLRGERQHPARLRTGNSAKYSPLMTERARRAGFPVPKTPPSAPHPLAGS